MSRARVPPTRLRWRVEPAAGRGVVVVAFLVSPALLGSVGVRSTVAGVVTLIAYLYLAAISVVLALIDIDTRRLPNAIVLPSYLVGGVLLTSAALLGGDLARMGGALLGAGVAAAVYGVLWLASPTGMGLGDVKLAGVLGLFLGYLGRGTFAVGLLTPFLLGGVFAFGLVVLRRVGRKSGIPFGPWMLAGAWVGIVAGAPL